MRSSQRLPDLRPLLIASLASLAIACAESEPRGLAFVVPEGDGWTLATGEGPTRPSFIDFGYVPNGTSVAHTFYVRNEDVTAVEIERLDASCGCTVPSVFYLDDAGERVHGDGDPSIGEPVLTLPAGAVAQFTVRLDTRQIARKNIDKYNFVRVITSSAATPYLQLEAHIIAAQPFHSTPKTIDFGRVAQSGGGVATTDIARGVESTVRLIGIESLPDELLATIEQEWIGSVPIWTVRAEIVQALSVGDFRGEITFELQTVEGAPYPSFRVPVVASVAPDLEVRPARLHLGQLDPLAGGKGSVEVLCNVPDHRVKVLGAEVQGDFAEALEVTWVPRSQDASGRSEAWEIRLAAQAGVDAEVIEGSVIVTLDDAEFSPVVIPYAAISQREPVR